MSTQFVPRIAAVLSYWFSGQTSSLELTLSNEAVEFVSENYGCTEQFEALKHCS